MVREALRSIIESHPDLAVVGETGIGPTRLTSPTVDVRTLILVEPSLDADNDKVVIGNCWLLRETHV